MHPRDGRSPKNWTCLVGFQHIRQRPPVKFNQLFDRKPIMSGRAQKFFVSLFIAWNTLYGFHSIIHMQGWHFHNFLQWPIDVMEIILALFTLAHIKRTTINDLGEGGGNQESSNFGGSSPRIFLTLLPHIEKTCEPYLKKKFRSLCKGKNHFNFSFRLPPEH